MGKARFVVSSPSETTWARALTPLPATLLLNSALSHRRVPWSPSHRLRPRVPAQGRQERRVRPEGLPWAVSCLLRSRARKLTWPSFPAPAATSEYINNHMELYTKW